MNAENTNAEKTDFEKAATARRPGIIQEFFYFLKNNKRWWLIPILVTIALLAALCFFASTGVAPFIYTIF
jgi:hypothetical protein